MAVSNTEKDKALDAALLQIQKQFGKGAIMKLGDDNALTDIQAISTGSITLDVATGIGGVPRGIVPPPPSAMYMHRPGFSVGVKRYVHKIHPCFSLKS